MSELLSFATRLIEAHGGAAELDPPRANVLLSGALADRLDLPEEVTLGPGNAGEIPITYGSATLVRLLALATSGLPLLRARLDIEAPADRLGKAAARGFVLRNGVCDPGGVHASSSERLIAHLLLTLEADEERRHLLPVTIAAKTGVPVPGFADEATAPRLEISGRTADPPSSMQLTALKRAAWAEASPFTEAFTQRMQDRFERERRRELRSFGRLAAAAEPGAAEALTQERDQKLGALAERFAIRAEIRLLAVIRVQAATLACDFSLRRRKATRRLDLEYDAATRALVPPPCDACQGPAVKPAACDDAFHLLCRRCLPSASGRPRCPACR